MKFLRGIGYSQLKAIQDLVRVQTAYTIMCGVDSVEYAVWSRVCFSSRNLLQVNIKKVNEICAG